MEIRKAQQSLEIKKVEEDKREEVKKIKPGFQQETPDSFELGRSRDENTNSQTTESNPKVDQAADAILVKQMTTARLAPARLQSNEQREIKSRKELGTDEQNAANSNGHNVPESNPGMETGTSSGPRVPQGAYAGDARSRIGEADQALRDLVAKSGTNLNPKDDSTRSHGGPNDSTRSHGGPSGSYTGGNPLEGGPTGPPSATDAMNSVNQKFEQAQKFAGGMNSTQNPADAFRDAVASADQSSTDGYGNDMMANDGEKQSRADKAAEGALQIIDGLTSGSGSDTYNGTKKLNDATDGWLGKGIAVVAAATVPVLGGIVLQSQVKVDQQTGEQGVQDAVDKKEMEAAKKAADAAVKAREEARKKAEAEAAKAAEEAKKKEEEKKAADKKGAGTATDSDQETYERKKFEEQQKQKSEFFSQLGFDPYALPQRPVIQGDIDPAEDQQAAGGEHQPGLLQQFGKEGLVGNPEGVEGHSSGGSVNLGQRGGNIDYENGSGYMGANRTEDPQDVDVSGSPLGRLNVVSRDEKKEEEEESSRVTTQKKRT